MIKIENVQICGWEPTIRGMRNPLNSWAKSDSHWDYILPDNKEEDKRIVDRKWINRYWLGDNDKDLMERLAKGGPAHAKYRRFITVYLDILAPLYWWKEFETYKVGTDSNSCSTMHKIAAKEFTLDDFSHEHLAQEGNKSVIDIRSRSLDGDISYDWMGSLLVVIKALNGAREKYLKTKEKFYWWQMIQLLPSSYNQRRTIKLNYETLYRIYHDRKGHKLDEWNEFCAWIESLQISEVITGPKIEEKEDSPWIPCTDEHAKMPDAGDEVLCTLKVDWSYGEGTDIQHHVFEGIYKLTKEDCFDMPAANGKGYFEANNDWNEGQPLAVIAWMPKPEAYEE